ncbi:hypothetical protein TNCT_443471 [Trichonephila clavata]|uniref:Uncharacterized protein n=1 Tax=Trichonephila clavata TaxID=2740835 RepID=A0A8X6LCK7_TRICU|nr:hypothetical protein TNCT_443471 [Trichonephila clavata]
MEDLLVIERYSLVGGRERNCYIWHIIACREGYNFRRIGQQMETSGIRIGRGLSSSSKTGASPYINPQLFIKLLMENEINFIRVSAS